MFSIRTLLTIFYCILSAKVVKQFNACHEMTKFLDGTYCYAISSSECHAGQEYVSKNISVNVKEISAVYNSKTRQFTSSPFSNLVINRITNVEFWRTVNIIGIVSLHKGDVSDFNFTCYLPMVPPERNCRSTFVVNSQCDNYESNCGRKIQRTSLIDASGKSGRQCLLKDEKNWFTPCQNCSCTCWKVLKVELYQTKCESCTMLSSSCKIEIVNGFCQRKAEFVISSCTNKSNQCSKDTCMLSEWTEWSECTVSCGKGTKTRSRINRLDCDTEAIQCLNFKYPCDSCQIFFSNWSKCNDTCGGRGIQNVNSSKSSGCTSDEQLVDRNCPTDPCPENCLLSDWTEWSLCDKTCGRGKRNRSRLILHQGAFNGTTCNQNISLWEEKNCFGEYRECQKNCTLSEWTVWSMCSHPCIPKNGEAFENRTKTIIRKSTTFAKKKCPSSLPFQERFCLNKPRCRSEFGLGESEEGNISFYLIIVAGVVTLIVSLSFIATCFSYNKRRRSREQLIKNFERTYKESVKAAGTSGYEKILPLDGEDRSSSTHEVKSNKKKYSKKDSIARYEPIVMDSSTKLMKKFDEKSSRYQNETQDASPKLSEKVVRKDELLKNGSITKSNRQISNRYVTIRRVDSGDSSIKGKKKKQNN